MTLETTTHKSLLINILREIYSDALIGASLLGTPCPCINYRHVYDSTA
jgi:hypothetical protein